MNEVSQNITVGIICPASIEYKTCRDVLGLSNEIEIQGRPVSKGFRHSVEIIAVQAGPGKIQSASAAQLVIDRFEPDIILDVGGAGALNPEVNIFDIVCCEYVYEFDICAVEEFWNQAEDLTVSTLLSELPDRGKEILCQFAEQIKVKEKTGFFVGNIISGEKNVAGRSLREKLYVVFQAMACNWESSAILKTAKLNGVKAMSFRVITDSAGEDMPKELKVNWEKALKILCSVIEKFLSEGWLLKILICPEGNKSRF